MRGEEVAFREKEGVGGRKREEGKVGCGYRGRLRRSLLHYSFHSPSAPRLGRKMDVKVDRKHFKASICMVRKYNYY